MSGLLLSQTVGFETTVLRISDSILSIKILAREKKREKKIDFAPVKKYIVHLFKLD